MAAVFNVFALLGSTVPASRGLERRCILETLLSQTEASSGWLEVSVDIVVCAGGAGGANWGLTHSRTLFYPTLAQPVFLC